MWWTFQLPYIQFSLFGLSYPFPNAQTWRIMLMTVINGWEPEVKSNNETDITNQVFKNSAGTESKLTGERRENGKIIWDNSEFIGCPVHEIGNKGWMWGASEKRHVRERVVIGKSKKDIKGCWGIHWDRFLWLYMTTRKWGILYGWKRSKKTQLVWQFKLIGLWNHWAKGEGAVTVEVQSPQVSFHAVLGLRMVWCRTLVEIMIWQKCHKPVSNLINFKVAMKKCNKYCLWLFGFRNSSSIRMPAFCM